MVMGVRDRGKGGFAPPPQKKIGKKYFSGKDHVKFGHFVNFSYILFSGKNVLPPPKLTELPPSYAHDHDHPNKYFRGSYGTPLTPIAPHDRLAYRLYYNLVDVANVLCTDRAGSPKYFWLQHKAEIMC